MMHCDEVRKRIYPLLDDELETETNIQVLAHLNVCDRCQETFEAERTFLNDLSDALTDREVPVDVMDDVRRRVKEAKAKRTESAWFAGSNTWENLKSAAVFLVLLITAGVLSTYFPLHRSNPSDQVFHTFPTYHQGVVNQNKEAFRTHVKEPNQNRENRSFSRMQALLGSRFPEFRHQLQVPPLEKQECAVIDAEVRASENSDFGASIFHMFYCHVLDQTNKVRKHRKVMLIGVNAPEIHPEGRSELYRVDGSDQFYTMKNPHDTRFVFWKEQELLMALGTTEFSWTS